MSQNSTAPKTFGADVRLKHYAPEELIGREVELELLNDAWAGVTTGEIGRPHVLTFVAFGGEGKTSLVAKWAAELAHQNWLGCDAAFAWSFYHQGANEKSADSSDLFLKEALTFFGDPAMASSTQAAFDKGRRLAQLVGERRALLILDGLEPLQYAPTSPTPGELKDQGLVGLLKGVAIASHGLCVVTTRYAIPDLRAFLGRTVREVRLTRLSRRAGVKLLKDIFRLNGSLRQTISFNDDKERLNEFEKLVEDVRGHALTLNLLGSYLRDAHNGDIRRRDLVKLEEADAEEQGGHAFRVMDAYVLAFEHGSQTEAGLAKGHRAVALLSLLGLFDRPATADCLNALWQGKPIAALTEPLVGLSEAERNLCLTRLQDAKLLTVDRDESSGVLATVDAHPVLREYFARRLREQRPEAWRSGHRRLYHHLCATTKEGEQPTLEDLQPLYQAVAHGCHAGLQQEAFDEVYFARTLRGYEYYSVKKLGAFGSDLGAVTCFFDLPWSRVSPALSAASQAELLNETGCSLRALGRLTEALLPMRSGLPIELKLGDWRNAAIRASNLSELEMMLGNVNAAVQDAEQSITYADRSGVPDQVVRRHVTFGDALHQAGCRPEAEARFRAAEQLHAETHPEFALLGSVQGFRYCDLLLAPAERVAWRRTLDPLCVVDSSLLTTARDVSERATQTLKWAQHQKISILSIAPDHLTLGRAALYNAIFEDSSLDACRENLQSAVANFRKSGAQQYIPLGLLTRAWLRCLIGAPTGPESAQNDLDEAWEIAQRGHMKLFLAEIHLHRARLFCRETPYPFPHPDGTPRSPRDDLTAARRLIEKCGYWRRKEELEDAEAVVNPL